MITDREDLRWWKRPKGRRHEAVTALLKSMQDRQAHRRKLNSHHALLYSDRALDARFHPHLAELSRSMSFEKRPRLAINVVKSCIDSATSMITKSRPRPAFLTDGGDWQLQTKAKKRGQFVEAVFQEQNAYHLGQRAFKNGGIFGTGILKVCREHGKVRIENSFPGEVFVDDYEAIYGEPRTFFQVRTMDKLVLSELYPSAKKDIADAPSPDSRTYGRATIADQCEVFQVWHLASGPDAGDGMELTCIQGADLDARPYRWESPPFACFRWNEEPIGWYGTGIAQELTGIQWEINKLVRSIQLAMHHAGSFKILIENGSKVVDAHFNNDLRGLLLHYSGTPPQVISHESVHPQMIQMLQFHIDQAYAITGISQLGARSEMPAGVTGSGRSMLVYQNIESERFVHVQRQYELMYMELAERVLEAASDLADDGDLSVKYTDPDGKYITELTFDEIDAPADAFRISVTPSSMLDRTLAGKFAQLEQAQGNGWIEPREARKLSGLADLQAEMDLQNAPIELIDQRIARILEKGELLSPHPRMDLELALKRAVLAYQRAELRGVDPKNIEKLGDFIESVLDQLGVPTDEDSRLAASQAAVRGLPIPTAAPPLGAAPPDAGIPPAAAGGVPPPNGVPTAPTDGAMMS